MVKPLQKFLSLKIFLLLCLSNSLIIGTDLRYQDYSPSQNLYTMENNDDLSLVSYDFNQDYDKKQEEEKNLADLSKLNNNKNELMKNFPSVTKIIKGMVKYALALTIFNQLETVNSRELKDYILESNSENNISAISHISNNKPIRGLQTTNISSINLSSDLAYCEENSTLCIPNANITMADLQNAFCFLPVIYFVPDNCVPISNQTVSCSNNPWLCRPAPHTTITDLKDSFCEYFSFQCVPIPVTNNFTNITGVPTINPVNTTGTNPISINIPEITISSDAAYCEQDMSFSCIPNPNINRADLENSWCYFNYIRFNNNCVLKSNQNTICFDQDPWLCMPSPDIDMRALQYDFCSYVAFQCVPKTTTTATTTTTTTTTNPTVKPTNTPAPTTVKKNKPTTIPRNIPLITISSDIAYCERNIYQSCKPNLNVTIIDLQNTLCFFTQVCIDKSGSDCLYPTKTSSCLLENPFPISYLQMIFCSILPFQCVPNNNTTNDSTMFSGITPLSLPDTSFCMHHSCVPNSNVTMADLQNSFCFIPYLKGSTSKCIPIVNETISCFDNPWLCKPASNTTIINLQNDFCDYYPFKCIPNKVIATTTIPTVAPTTTPNTVLINTIRCNDDPWLCIPQPSIMSPQMEFLFCRVNTKKCVPLNGSTNITICTDTPQLCIPNSNIVTAELQYYFCYFIPFQCIPIIKTADPTTASTTPSSNTSFCQNNPSSCIPNGIISSANLKNVLCTSKPSYCVSTDASINCLYNPLYCTPRSSITTVEMQKIFCTLLPYQCIPKNSSTTVTTHI